MLWYKSWLETRWRFLIGLALLMLLGRRHRLRLSAGDEADSADSAISTRAARSAGASKRPSRLQRDYRGYIWSQWIRQNLTQMATLFAVLLGTGGLLSQRSELFTLSLPVSRRRLVSVRAMAGLGELLVIIVVSFLVIPLFSPSVGQRYGVGDGAGPCHLCLFVASAAFFSLARCSRLRSATSGGRC